MKVNCEKKKLMKDSNSQHILLAALLQGIGRFYQNVEKFQGASSNPDTPTGTCNQALECLHLVEGKIGSIPGVRPDKLQAILAEEDSLCGIISKADDWCDEKSDSLQNAGAKSLASIFNKINEGAHNSRFGLSPLNLDDRAFPSTENENDPNKAIKGLWLGFMREFQKLPTGSFTSFTESLLSLLKKYTWCVPCTSGSVTDISLYEHYRIMAAFSECLYSFTADNQCEVESMGLNARPALLVGGDISGIQKFIYDVTSSKAAVSLKGKSFYLQLLIDTIIQRIICHEDICCTTAQVVYSSGGKFYMLLPNTQRVKTALAEIKTEMDEELWSEHYGHLAIGIEYIPFLHASGVGTVYCGESSKPVEIGTLWKLLADKLSAYKGLKFKSYIENHFESLFTPQSVSQEAICAVTGIEGYCVKNGEDNVLPSVMQQIDLGKRLKGAEYILTTNDSTLVARLKAKPIKILGTNICFLTEADVKDKGKEDFGGFGSARIRRINSTDYLDIFNGLDACYSFQFYGGNRQAQVGGSNKTFAQLADGAHLGVLRMDVDNLGAIFIKGFPEGDKSFPAYATLSFLLDYFFSGYLNTIREREEFRNDVNILYSGGDDVFAIGKWDRIILFAEAIRKEFARFTGREDLSISGGVAIVGDKFPIAKAAALAGEAEDRAKRFRGNEKNAITIFGESISWNKEYDYVKQNKDMFVSLVNKEKMPKSILQRIMILNRKRKKADPSYLWHTVYYLKRFSENKNQSIISFCNKAGKDICTNPRHYELFAVAARWAELECQVNK